MTFIDEIKENHDFFNACLFFSFLLYFIYLFKRIYMETESRLSLDYIDSIPLSSI